MTISKLSEKCAKCSLKNICNVKRMEALAEMQSVIDRCEPNKLIPDASINLMQGASNPILNKVDMRSIKIDANTTVDINLEDVKRQIAKSIYPSFLREAT